MRISVQYTTQLKAALGIGQEEVSTETNTTLPQLFAQLASSHGSPFIDHVMDDTGQLRPAIIVCVDDRQVELSDDVALHDGATVTLLSAISGG